MVRRTVPVSSPYAYQKASWLGDAQKLSLHLCALMHSFYQSETNAARLVYCCASP
jgi:hypothetical protein